MRTAMRAAAVAAVATCAIAGTVGAASTASAAPSHWATISAPSHVNANTTFKVNGEGYDARTNSGYLCLQGRVLVNGTWSSWHTLLCAAHRSGHHLYVHGVADGGWPAGNYDLRMVLESHPRAGVWKPLDYSKQHYMTVR